MPVAQQISSAVGGKQAAPKAPPRRRPPQQLGSATPSTQATPATESVTTRQTSVTANSTHAADRAQRHQSPDQAKERLPVEKDADPSSPAPIPQRPQFQNERVPASPELHVTERTQASSVPKHGSSLVESNAAATTQQPSLVTPALPTPPPTQLNEPAFVHSETQPPSPPLVQVPEPEIQSDGPPNASGKRKASEDQNGNAHPTKARRISKRRKGPTDKVQDGDHPESSTETHRTTRKRRAIVDSQTSTAQGRLGQPRKELSEATATSDNNNERGYEDTGESEYIASGDPAVARDSDRADPTGGSGLKTRKRQRKRRGPPVDEQGSEVGDPENHQIDAHKVVMFDLGFDSRLGKISEREQNMSQADWVKAKRERREVADRVFNGVRDPANDEHPGPVDARPEAEQGTNPVGEGGTEAVVDQQEAEPENANISGGLGFRINADGEIVEDEATLRISGGGEEGGQGLLEVEVEEEEDLTRRINRSTFVNDRRRDPRERVEQWRLSSGPWNEDATDEFYRQLGLLGTDFEAIARTFPGKTRHMIKMKFTREEKLDPERITRTLLNPESRPQCTLESYAADTGMSLDFFNKYDSLEHAMRVIGEDMKEKEQQMQDAVRENQEQERQRVVQADKREKALEAKEARKKQRDARRHARRRGVQLGAGAMA